MDLDKFIELYEIVETMSVEQKNWVYANLNHIIEKYNEKYNKNVDVRFLCR